MTETPPLPARAKFRIPALVGAIVFATLAASIGWLTVGDSGGCAAETPAVFSRIYHISSATMEPTVQQGDWLWAERRYYCTRDPERGDLAALALASRPETVFVKRVIGLPGDRVQLKQARLYLNGEPVRRDWLESAIHADEAGEASQRARFMETLPNEAHYAVEVADPEAPLENTEEVTVPAGQYFVLGDNRGHSEDSRAPAFGLVPRASIADRPALVLWSGDKSRIGVRLGARP
ncbi:MAG TPA: signal peptidase I [Stellaceae bacterium]|nr:signal peptidase I [Stellaceae bacterium]